MREVLNVVVVHLHFCCVNDTLLFIFTINRCVLQHTVSCCIMYHIIFTKIFYTAVHTYMSRHVAVVWVYSVPVPGSLLSVVVFIFLIFKKIMHYQ